MTRSHPDPDPGAGAPSARHPGPGSEPGDGAVLKVRTGTIRGIGVGPGDPELMSVRATRLLGEARHVAFFRKAGREGQALTIARGAISADASLHPMEYPVTVEIPVTDPRYNEILAGFYDQCRTRLRDIAATGEDVSVLCEGDPFLYGSFMHLHARLRDEIPVEVVPAITGMSGAWTVTGSPMAWGDDVLTVIPGTLPEGEIARRARDTDALVVMKIGRNFEKTCRALDEAGRLDDAWLVERATMPGQAVSRLADAWREVSGDDGPGERRIAPYFSIVVVHGRGRRP